MVLMLCVENRCMNSYYIFVNVPNIQKVKNKYRSRPGEQGLPPLYLYLPPLNINLLLCACPFLSEIPK